MNLIASNSNSIQDTVRNARQCQSHCIVADDKEIYGRPRAEADPKQEFAYGDTVAYQIDVLIPADHDPFAIDGEPKADSFIQFHQYKNTQPGVPFQLNIRGDLIQCTGYHPNGKWFQGIQRLWVPEEWMTFRIETKWHDTDGWRKCFKADELLYEYIGGTCVKDDRGAPHMRYGPQQGKWDNKQQKYIRFFYANLLVEGT